MLHCTKTSLLLRWLQSHDRKLSDAIFCHGIGRACLTPISAKDFHRACHQLRLARERALAAEAGFASSVLLALCSAF